MPGPEPGFLFPYCYFKCLTFSNVPDGTAISIFSHLKGGYIVQNEQLNYSESETTICWDISQYGSGNFDVYLIVPEGDQLYIVKEELFRTVLPTGWSSFGTPACLGMSEGGLDRKFAGNSCGFKSSEIPDKKVLKVTKYHRLAPGKQAGRQSNGIDVGVICPGNCLPVFRVQPEIFCFPGPWKGRVSARPGAQKLSRFVR